MRKRSICIAALLVCLLAFTGSAPVIWMSPTPDWAAETPLYHEPVCPTLLPGGEDGSVVIRWVSWQTKTVWLHFGPDDGSGTLGPDHEILPVDPERSALGLTSYSAELPIGRGNWLYSLTEEGEAEPGVLYSVRGRQEGSFRLLMSSDSHVCNAGHAALYEEAMQMGLAERGADLILNAGDVNDNTEATPYLLSHNAPHTRSVPTLTVVGNHDRAGILYAYFTPPHLDPVTQDYWTVQGKVLFVGLNINDRYTEAHRRYLTEAVEAHRESCDWVVLLIHYSMMSNGAHAPDGPVLQFRDALRETISELDIDLVLSGHDHEYDRSYLIDAENMIEGSGGESVVKKEGETLYLSLPTATGVKLYKRTRASLYPLAAEGELSHRGYVTADFDEESVTVTAVSVTTGETVDHFVLTRASAE